MLTPRLGNWVVSTLRRLVGLRRGRGGPRTAAVERAPALPLPPGWSEAALLELVTSVQVEDGPRKELENYARSDLRRFLYTLGLVPDIDGLRVLELGANPYFTTALMSKFRDLQLELANFFGGEASEGAQNVVIHGTGETLRFAYKHFNAEQDRFPFADGTFDGVLFCEILEHLLLDPVHALLEIRRVLKPNGFLILTTPNVARLENVARLLRGESIYDPYSGYGPYGRHNREFSTGELLTLLTANGFHVEVLFTADVGARPAMTPLWALVALAGQRGGDLGQYIFSRSRIAPGAERLHPARPTWLYRSLPKSA